MTLVMWACDPIQLYLRLWRIRAVAKPQGENFYRYGKA
jgi:hypothetical protein